MTFPVQGCILLSVPEVSDMSGFTLSIRYGLVIRFQIDSR